LHCVQTSGTGQEDAVPETWSTSDVARAAQFGYWRELICAAFLALTPESDLRDGFTGTVTQQPLGALSLARITSQRQRVRRTGTDIARVPRTGYYANLQLTGVSEMRQGGRATVLRPGDLAVVDTGEPFAFDFGDDFRQLSFHVPAALLEAQLSGRVRTATRIGTGHGVGAAVRHALQALPTLPGPAAERLAVHACGLLAVALDQPGPPERGAGRRSHAQAVADIEEHLADDDLSPAATARRLGVSVRGLHGIFAGHELSYAATVRQRRLEQAYRDLRDPARAQLRVIDIATDAGFADVTSFHRAFRREYGHTPAQARQPR
jgi:AraC family transcriptional regulator, positive regulator of tynA and feaB